MFRVQLRDVDEVRAALVQVDVDLRGVDLRQIGRDWARTFADRLDQLALTPLTQTRRKLRRQAGFREDPPLIASGQLREGIKILDVKIGRIEVGVEGEKAAILHDGGETETDSLIPGERIPPRPFLEIDDDMRDRAVVRLTEMIFKGGR